MSRPNNTAAYLPSALAPSLDIGPSPYPSAGPGQLVLRNHAVAMNPIDIMIQDTDFFKRSYPLILGEDCAGEVVEIGNNVHGFEKGMRVLAHALSWPTKENRQGAFQEYTIVPASLTTRIPDNMKYEDAVVMPVAVTTAAAGLYQDDFLALDLPRTDTMALSKGQVVVIWGGSSNVGSAAIQLLKYSGYEVFATAGSNNLGYVENLGASRVFDYRKDDVVTEILSALKGKKLVGCYAAVATPEVVSDLVRIAEIAGTGKMIVSTNPLLQDLPNSDVTIKAIYAGTMAMNEIGPAIFHEFLQPALEKGLILTKPEPTVVGKGLDKIQEAISKLKAGASAQKFVVIL